MTAAELDALDRGVIEAGVTAAEALALAQRNAARIDALLRMMRQTCEAAGLPVPDDEATADPGLTKRERIEQLGLALVDGDETS